MRNAALMLGIIAGLMGIVVGLAGYGYAELSAARPEVNELFSLQNPSLIRFASFMAPLLSNSRRRNGQNARALGGED